MLTNNVDLIKYTRKILELLLHNHLDDYIDLFFYENPVKLNPEVEEVLCQSGIVRKEGGLSIANVMIFPFRGKFIITDFLFSKYKIKKGRLVRGIDDIWLMFPHETLYFIEELKENKVYGRALDIASGSGAIGLFLADRAEQVVSSDINPKAIQYQKFNAVLNNLEHKIESKKSDVFSNLNKEKFDFVSWNGPTVALPEVQNAQKVYPLYTYGGYDGAAFTKKFIDGVWGHLSDNYTIKWWDGSLGDKKMSVVDKYLRDKYSHLPIKVTIQYLNTRKGVPIHEYDKLYTKYCLNKFDLAQSRNNRESINWYKRLKKEGLSMVYISLITIQPADKFQVEYGVVPKTIVGPRQVFGFEWHFCSKAFIRRYILNHS